LFQLYIFIQEFFATIYKSWHVSCSIEVYVSLIVAQLSIIN